MSGQTPPPVPRGRAMTAQAATFVVLLFGLVAAVFVIQNTGSATIHFLFWSADVAIAGALLLALALGGLIGFLVAYVRQRQFRGRLRAQTRASALPAGEQREPKAAPPAERDRTGEEEERGDLA
jgi:uncharacterized integral membrane protein